MCARSSDPPQTGPPSTSCSRRNHISPAWLPHTGTVYLTLADPPSLPQSWPGRTCCLSKEPDGQSSFYLERQIGVKGFSSWTIESQESGDSRMTRIIFFISSIKQIDRVVCVCDFFFGGGVGGGGGGVFVTIRNVKRLR